MTRGSRLTVGLTRSTGRKGRQRPLYADGKHQNESHDLTSHDGIVLHRG
jgi:hypothetical protein